MFSKVLIANRGEIACRIIRSAKKMGIQTVAVYSDADRDALHTTLADEAISLGGTSAATSYLLEDKIIDAMKQTGAQAVHPGYGFLSENANFATRVQKEGFVFIGPPPDAIAKMGDKIESKRIAKKAGVNIIEGSEDAIKDAPEALRFAKKIGFPVMVKASAGGGGKGMRIVHHEKELGDALRLAQNEAKSSFGDERVFIEKFITSPRHIEIQVLADSHGHCIHLGERDCSLQRRHQKVIEEAPSPFVNDEMRMQMGAQAVALAQAVGYQSAGTVEFVAGEKGDFYFLEMNTRLQVEHPVTELVTELDLVEWMIKIAAGDKLTLKQEDIKRQGWAMEARIYAEDPARGFLPSIGRLTSHKPPQSPENNEDIVRLDTGVAEGDEITMFYDPMIAKLCVWSTSRAKAIKCLQDALDQYHIRGVAHNGAFLADVLRKETFQKGNITTHFIEEFYKDGFTGELYDDELGKIFALVGAYIEQLTMQMERSIGDQIEGVMPAKKASIHTAWDVLMGDKRMRLRLHLPEGHLASECIIELDGHKHELHGSWHPFEPLFSCRIDGSWYHIQIDRLSSSCGYQLSLHGQWADVLVLQPHIADYYSLMPPKVVPDLSRFLLAPMPGLLLSLAVKKGDAVRSGQELAVIEAMKMENILRAEKDGVIEEVNASVGDSLAVDEVILTFAQS